MTFVGGTVWDKTSECEWEHFVLANLFTKGIIFLTSCLRPWATNPTQKDPLLQQKKFAPRGANSFL